MTITLNISNIVNRLAQRSVLPKILLSAGLEIPLSYGRKIRTL